MTALDRYLIDSGISDERLALALQQRGLRVSARWIKALRKGLSEPSKKLGRAIVEECNGHVKISDLIDLGSAVGA